MSLHRFNRLEEFIRLFWLHKDQIKEYMPLPYPIVKYKNHSKKGDIISTAELCEIFVTSNDPLAKRFCYAFGMESGTEDEFSEMIRRLKDADLYDIAKELNKRKKLPYIDIQFSSNLLKPRESRHISNYENYSDGTKFLKYSFLSNRAEGYYVDWDKLEKAIQLIDGNIKDSSAKKQSHMEGKKEKRDNKLNNVSNLLSKLNEFNPTSTIDAREKVERSIVLRRGQKKFREALIILYEEQCAISGTSVKDALEAAHIQPYKGEDWNHPTNGILLRADLHTLFDLKMISIDPSNNKVVISKELENTYYAQYRNKKLFTVKEEDCLPNKQALKDHFDEFNKK